MKAPKYRNVKTTVDGIVLDSAKESRRYSELKLLERAGLITGLEVQPSFRIAVNNCLICTYKADFRYTTDTPHAQGVVVVEDCKGFKTPVYRLKKKLMLAVHGISVVET
jgi:hypothetical protein